MSLNSVKFHQIKSFGLVWIVYSLVYFLRKPVGVLKPELESSLNLTKHQLGWIDITLLLPYALVQIAGSGLWDIYAPRKLIFAFMISTALSMMLLGVFNNFIAVLSLLFISGASQAPIWPACTKVLTSWFPEDKLSTVFGYISTAQHTGSVAGTALAVYIMKALGWQAAFMPAGLAAIITAVFGYIFLKTSFELEIDVPGKINVSEYENHSDKCEDGNQPRSNNISSIWKIIAVPEITLAMFCIKFQRYAIYMWLPLYLIEFLHYDKTTAGIFSTAYDIGGILGGPIFGMILDRFFSASPLQGIFWLSLSGSLGLLLVDLGVAAHGFFYCFVLFALVGFSSLPTDSLITGSVTMSIGEKYGNGRGAGVTSLVNGISGVGAIIEGPIVGFLSQFFGWSGVVKLLVLLSLLSTIFIKYAQSKITKYENVLVEESQHRKSLEMMENGDRN